MAPTKMKEKSLSFANNNNFHGTKLSPCRRKNRLLVCFGFPCKYDHDSLAKKAAEKSVKWKKKKKTAVEAGQNKKNKKYYFKISWSKFRLTIKTTGSAPNQEAAPAVPPNLDRNSSSSSISWKTQARKLMKRFSFIKTSARGTDDHINIVPKEDQSFYDCHEHQFKELQLAKLIQESMNLQVQDHQPAAESSMSRSQSDSWLLDTNCYRKPRSPPSTTYKYISRKEELQQQDADEAGHDKDPLIGISIVLMTLIIMLVWGRLCAIFCTSACFYGVPRFIASTSTKNHDHVDCWINKKHHMDIINNSDLFKKTMILQGLLQRNHKRK